MKKKVKNTAYRIEKDVMGSVRVPAHAFYGIQTVRAYHNFHISGLGIHQEMLRALLRIKMAAAAANVDCRMLDKRKGTAIIKACAKILKGGYENQFILDVYQAGAGTPWHMNVNEVVANVALDILGREKGEYGVIDPHNHVNMAQSSNDVIPTSMRIASLVLTEKLVVEIKELIRTLRRNEKKFWNYAKSGRTHLMDAVPIRLGQEFGAWASTLEKRLDVLKMGMVYLRHLHIGGTAVGTGFNTHKRFGKIVVKELKKLTRLNVSVAKDRIEETEFMSDFLDLSGALRTIAVDLGKICNDIRLLGSGPTTGLNEIKLPQVEPGSSIMPGKFNPSMAEMMNMVCYQIIGNDEVIREAVGAGQLDLNAMTPVLAHNLFHSLDILRNGIREFNWLCVKGIEANKDVLREYFVNNPSFGTLLNKRIGYDKTAELVSEALEKGKTISEIAVDKGLLSQKEAEKLFSIKNLLRD